MRRFYLPPLQCQNEPLFLTGREAHHALRVMRIRRGERVTVLNGAGEAFLCEVAQFDRDKVQLRLLERHAAPPLPCHITLVQAIPKGKMEFIIQKATELGVSRIVPLLSDRVIVQSTRERSGKVDKWRTIALEAIKQCGSAWLPEIENPLSIPQFLARQESFELNLLASLQSDSGHPGRLFHTFQKQHGRQAQKVCIWIGPEGDFSPEEIDQIRSAGASPISLGTLVLRSDTAALCCLAIVNYELGRTDLNR